MSKILGLTIFLISAFYFTAYAEIDAEKADQETSRFERQQREYQRLLKPIPIKPPEIMPKEEPVRKKEGEARNIFIRKITLTGLKSFSEDKFKDIVSKYQNKELDINDFNVLNREIQERYLKLGVIAVAFIPEQDIKDGLINLQIIESRMGDLIIQKHKYFRSGRLNYYWQIRKDDIIRYNKISRSVQMMNKNPDRKVKVSLKAGSMSGTTDIVLTPETTFPLHPFFTYDREGSGSTGRSRFTFGARHNNFLGLDDTLISGYNFGQSFEGSYVYHSLPLTPKGMSAVYGYSRSVSIPLKEYAVYKLRSEAKSATVSLYQDIYRNENYLGEAFLRFSAKDKTVKSTNIPNGSTEPTNRDRQRIFSLGANFVSYGFNSMTTISPEYSQGVHGFGASRSSNPIASRSAKPVFSKFNFDISHKKRFQSRVEVNYRFQSQLASRKLTPQETFALGGIDSVRGYPSGDYQADAGLFNSLELSTPVPFSFLKDKVSWIMFVDQGWGKRRGQSAGDKSTANFAGVGSGIRIKLFEQIMLRLEWGFPVGDKTITEAANSIFHFSIDFQQKTFSPKKKK